MAGGSHGIPEEAGKVRDEALRRTVGQARTSGANSIIGINPC